MSRSLRRSVSLFLAVAGIGLCSTIAISQTDDLKENQLRSDRKATYEFTNRPVDEVLRSIAERGGLQIIVKSDVTGSLPAFKLENVTPEQAIQKVSEMADLQWQRLENGVYIVSKRATPLSTRPSKTFDLEALDKPYNEVFKLIELASDTKILTFGSLPGNLKFIQLRDTTVEKAVDTVVRAAGGKWFRMKDGSIAIMGQNPLPSAIAMVPRAPGMRIIPGPSNRNEPIPPSWRSFQFQGRTFYHVPLQ